MNTQPTKEMEGPAAVKEDTARAKKRPRFKLCFASDCDSTSGKYKWAVKLCGISPSIITPKFYSSSNARLTEDEEREVEEIAEKMSEITHLGPREKFNEPILESHRYGWFQQKFGERLPEVDRLHFPRRTSEMVTVQNLLYNSSAQK